MKKWTINHSKFLTEPEIDRLYIQLKDAKDLAIHRGKNLHHVRDYFILRILLETGLRVFELTNLKVGDFFEGKILVQNGKGGKSGSILLTNDTQKMIREFIRVKKRILKESTNPDSPLIISERGNPYTTRGLRKRVKYWFKQCNFSENLSIHSCRHSFISGMIRAGVDLVTVRDNARHSNISVTSLYLHSSKDNLGDIELYKRNSS